MFDVAVKRLEEALWLRLKLLSENFAIWVFLVDDSVPFEVLAVIWIMMLT